MGDTWYRNLNVFLSFDVCIRGQLGKDDEIGRDVMHRIWEGLQETHRLRCVNSG